MNSFMVRGRMKNERPWVGGRRGTSNFRVLQAYYLASVVFKSSLLRSLSTEARYSWGEVGSFYQKYPGLRAQPPVTSSPPDSLPGSQV